MQKIINQSEDFCEIPQIVGVIDGCHVTILAPTENKEDYFNRKHAYSVNFLGILDSQMLFLHVSVGYPGSIHDSRVLQLYNIYRELKMVI